MLSLEAHSQEPSSPDMVQVNKEDSHFSVGSGNEDDIETMEALHERLKHAGILLASVKEAEAIVRFVIAEKETINNKAIIAKENFYSTLEMATEKLNYRESAKNTLKTIIENENRKLDARMCAINHAKSNASLQLRKIHKHLIKRLAVAEEQQKQTGKEWERIEQDISIEVEKQEKEIKTIKRRSAVLEEKESELRKEKESLDQYLCKVNKSNIEVESIYQELDKVKMEMAGTLDPSGCEIMAKALPEPVQRLQGKIEKEISDMNCRNSQVAQAIPGFDNAKDVTLALLCSINSLQLMNA